MAKISKQEFIEKYGQIKVKFSSYYKYTFTYTGKLEDDTTIAVKVGGNSDDIYRHEVSADLEETIESLDPYSGMTGTDNFYDY